MTVKKHDQRHINFVQEYFYGLSKGKAEVCAELAGYSRTYGKTHSWSWVGECREKAKNKTLWDLVQKERKKIAKTYGITSQQVMDGYIRESNFDPRRLVDEDGNAKLNINELDDDTALSLAGLEFDEKLNGDVIVSRKIKYKFPDKKGNRDSMAKIKGMFVEKHRIVDSEDNDVEPTGNLEVATRLAYLINQATGRKNADTDSGPDK